ncbi:MAG: hypothetical protein K2P81_05870 [Bacteriovoracaceae bacterium]|nr:hypothetical protein [Bacteriovoracaceae bacterium]
MKNIVFLNEKDTYLVGNKALKLQELSCAGFPVPPGFTLLNSKFDKNEVLAALEKIGGFPVAVRSSGTIEDLAGASFAGMYETYLEIESADALFKAIEDCYLSATSGRVHDYISSKGKTISTEELKASMRVLIQKMVPADRAGVMFTIDPVNGKEEHQYIEICQGLGERLVSGHVTPSRFYYNWFDSKLDQFEINDEGAHLHESELREISRLGAEIQAHYEFPQDIEFAIDRHSKIWVLQSRPVTHFSWRKDVPEITNADFKDGGVSARVCHRMMYSIYERAIQNSMGRYFEEINLIKSRDSYKWIFYFYGRAYWNVGAVKEALGKIPGFSEESFDRDLGITKDYGAKGPVTVKVGLQSILVALNALCGLIKEYRSCKKMIDEFTPWFEKRDEAIKSKLLNVSSLEEDEFWDFAKEVVEFQFKTESNYFRTIYNNSNMQSDFKNAMRKADPNDEIDFLKLLSGLPHMAHMDIQKDLESLARYAETSGFESDEWKRQMNMFLQHHYHHGDAELDLTCPRWGERPERVVEIVKGMMGAAKVERVNAEDWQSEWLKLCEMKKRDLSWKFFGKSNLWNLLLDTRDYLVRRELMRTLSTRAYYVLRLVLIEGEKRLGLPSGDIHYLRIEEFISRSIPEKDLMKRYKQYISGYRNFEAPNEFGGTLLERSSEDLNKNELKGIGCSSGEIEAVVRVIQKIEDASYLQTGEVLVTKFTDPGWTPIMSRAAAVITEVGGVLSHAAVIGREYKIPAVLNVSNATKILVTGERIRINGRSGIISRLEKDS